MTREEADALATQLAQLRGAPTPAWAEEAIDKIVALGDRVLTVAYEQIEAQEAEQ